MALIKVYADRKLVGLCGSECYNADGGDCDCCCQGLNHGVGLKRAAENTRGISLAGLVTWADERVGIKESVSVVLLPQRKPPHRG